MATQNTGNARNILVGASPLFLSVTDITSADYVASAPAGTLNAFAANKNKSVPAFRTGLSYTDSLNDMDTATAATDGTARVIANPSATPAVAAAASTQKGAFYRNVGYTNNGLQVTYNPSYGSVTVDQLLDTAKLFKESMEVMIATEMAEGTLENVLAVFGQKSDTLTESGKKLGLAGGALGEAPTERQLIAVGQAPTSQSESLTERVYYARRVLSVQQSQFSLARNAASTFPVTFRLLPSGDSAHTGQEYGFIVDRVLSA
jgi:hypothetical protein